MNRIDRLFGILTILQSNKYTSADQLASRFNMSIRTVYRDIRAIQEQGVPVGFESHKGYFLIQGYFLPPISFNSDEANALLLVESLVNGFADNSIRTHYTAALSKVKAVLKSSQKEKLDGLNAHIHFQLPEQLNYNFNFLSLVQQAISDRKILWLEYKSAKNEMSAREVEPIGLIFYAFSWHLIAWCHLRGEYRDFNLTRMIEIRNLNIPFKKEKHIALSEYMPALPVNY